MIGATSIISSLMPVRSVSFSDYKHFNRCLVASWPRNKVVFANKGISKPTSRAILVGLLYHEMLDALGDLYELDYESGVRCIRETFRQLITQYRERYADTLAVETSTIDYWPEISAIVQSVILVFERDLDMGLRPIREKPLTSEHLRMHGVIDEIIESTASITITEYKTTQDPARLDQERHLDQVHFYALLVKDYYSKRVRLRLQGLLGAFLDVPFDENRIAHILQNIQRFFEAADAINETSDVIDLCQVSRDTCPTCQYRLSCPAIFSSIHESIGSGNEVAILDNLPVTADNEYVVEVLAGTVPRGKTSLDSSILNPSLNNTSGRVAVDGITVKDGQLVLSKSSRIRQLSFPQ